MSVELTPEEVYELSKLGTPVISDVQGKHFNLHPRIKPLYPQARVCGPAVTVRSPISDNLTFHRAIDLAKQGDVIVVDSRGYISAGLFGEVMAIICQRKGIAGVVIDGACRDAQEIEEMGLPTFSAGINPGGTVKESLGPINVPISCGGVPVNPGDYVIGDRNGVVIIPVNDVKEVIRKGKAAVEKEKGFLKELEQGKPAMEVLGFNKLLKTKGLL